MARPRSRSNGSAPARRRGPVIASAERIRGGYEASQTIRRARQSWQPRAWQYYDLIGEVHDAGQFVAKGLSGLRLFVEKQNPDGTWDELDRDAATGGDDKVMYDIWDGVQDPGGGRVRLNANYGRQRVVAGESYLICTGLDDPSQPTRWEMVSTDELRPKGDGWERRANPTMREELEEPPEDAWEVMPGQVLVFHMWRPHPRYSGLADSPMRALIDVCEQVVLLSQALRNKARNRLKGSGLFLIPDEIGPPDEGDESDIDDSIAPANDTDPEDDPILSEIAKAITAPIADETDPSAVVPIMLRVPMETIASFRLIDFYNPQTQYAESAEIEKLVVRLARGFDMPPEMLLGIATANHWNAWMIDRQTWRMHLQSYADEMRTDYTTAFLWPQAIANKIAGFQSYRIGYDESEVVNNPDRSKDALNVYDRFGISWETLRDANGFTDADAPSPDEIQQRIEIASAGSSQAGAASSGGNTGQDATESEPSTSPASLEGAIQMSLLRCREIAGSRVRTRAARDPLVAVQIDGVHNRNVCSVLGNDAWLADQEMTADLLVRGGTDSLAAWMESEGYTQRRIAQVCSNVQRQAAAELFTVEL